MIVRERSAERNEADSLEHHVAIGIGQHFFFDPVPSLNLCIDQLEGRNTGRYRNIFERAVTFLFREVTSSVGDDQSHVAGTRLVHPRVINLVQNAVAGCEPHLAVLIQGCAHPTLRARCPARRNARPSRSISFCFTHWSILTGFSWY